MPERAPALFAAIATFACGCGYTSTYSPPDGWRARPLYNGNEVVMVGSTELPECVTEETLENEGDELPPRMMLDDDGYWVPAPRVHVVFWGPVFHPHPFVFHPPGPHNLLLGSLFGRGGGISSGGDGKGAVMVLAFAAAVAVVASSGVAIGLAVDPPEDDDEVAGGIDQVNLHNDRVRERIAECIRLAEARRAEPAAPPESTTASPAASPGVAPGSEALGDEVQAAPVEGSPTASPTASPTPSPSPSSPLSPTLRPSDPSAPSLGAAPTDPAGEAADPGSSGSSAAERGTAASEEEVPW